MKLRSVFVVGAFAILPLFAAMACSSTAQPPILDPGAKDGSSVSEGSTKDARGEGGFDVAIGDAGPCTPVPLNPGYINEDFVAQDMPTPMGGTIVDGVYTLAAAHDYTGPSGNSGPSATDLQETFVFSGSSLRATVDVKGSGGAVTEADTFAVVTPDGGAPNSMLDMMLVCSTNPNAITRTKLGFTVSGNTLTLYGPSVSNVLVRQ